MIELCLPWPDKLLSPNARAHWAKKGKAVKDARLMSCLTAKNAGWHRLVLPDGRLQLWIDLYPPDRRRRDDDNAYSACKAYRDGIADALGIDDSRFVGHPYLKDEVRKGGEVRVRITGGPTP
jgi:crossover junction endodeoxyribonuclease RusA